MIILVIHDVRISLVKLERNAPALGGLMELRNTADSQVDELFWRDSNIPANLTQERRRKIAASVDGHRRSATIDVAELLMRTALPHLDKTEPFQSPMTSRGLRTGREPTAA